MPPRTLERPMLFPEAKSALVRLSDCIKIGITAAGESSGKLSRLYVSHGAALAALRDTARRGLSGDLPLEEANRLCQRQAQSIPPEAVLQATVLQERLHSECLSVLLQTCFTLESYINSLGYHLLKEKDLLGLVGGGHAATAEILFDSIDKMSTILKWKTIGTINRTSGFDPARAPFQDLEILFRFRNDVVHDKVREYSEDLVARRYGRKLPDPVFGFLDLSHAVYAADTYWTMIVEVHRLVSVPIASFHRHYNLKPWSSADMEKAVRREAAEHAKHQRA